MIIVVPSILSRLYEFCVPSNPIFITNESFSLSIIALASSSPFPYRTLHLADTFVICLGNATFITGFLYKSLLSSLFNKIAVIFTFSFFSVDDNVVVLTSNEA